MTEADAFMPGQPASIADERDDDAGLAARAFDKHVASSFAGSLHAVTAASSVLNSWSVGYIAAAILVLLVVLVVLVVLVMLVMPVMLVILESRELLVTRRATAPI